MLKTILLIALRALHPCGAIPRLSAMACAILGALAILIGYLALAFATTLEWNLLAVVKQFEGEFKVVRTGESATVAAVSPAAEAGIHTLGMESGLLAAAVSAKSDRGMAILKVGDVETAVDCEVLGLGKSSGTPPATFMAGAFPALRPGLILADWSVLGVNLPAGEKQLTLTLKGRSVALIAGTEWKTTSPLLKRRVVVLTLEDFEQLTGAQGALQGPDSVFLFAKPSADIELTAKAIGSILRKTPETSVFLVTYWRDRFERLLLIIKGFWGTMGFVVVALVLVTFSFATCNLLATRRSHAEADMAFLAAGLPLSYWYWIAVTRGVWIGTLSVIAAAACCLSGLLVARLFPQAASAFAALRTETGVLYTSFFICSFCFVCLFATAALLAEKFHGQKSLA